MFRVVRPKGASGLPCKAYQLPDHQGDLMKHVLTGVIVLAAFPIAYFGGNIAFGILFDGSWLPYLLAMVLKPAALNIGLVISLWVIRACILGAIFLGAATR
jgi:hypothetical protein